MKPIKYNFNSSDIETCLFALSKFPLVDEESSKSDTISDVQLDINETCALSAIEKFSNLKIDQITANELRITCACIILCNGICKKESQASEQDYLDCMKYMFSLNKLANELCSQISIPD